MNIRDALAANIRSMRAKRDLDQESVAARMRALGFDAWIRQTVGATERGRRRPTAEEMIALAWVFNTTVMSLMDVSGNGVVHFPNGRDTLT